MGWLSLASMFLQIVLGIMNYLERQGAINEGMAKAVKILVDKADDLINRADEFRNNVSDDPAVLLRDEYDLDRETGGKPGNTVTVQLHVPDKV